MTDPTLADLYRSFADDQAAGISPSFHSWAQHVARDRELLELLSRLPREKQQPNLVFAAARLHGACPGDSASLRATLLGNWATVENTIRTRATQTNEAARGAAILFGLDQIEGPIALLEVGASAGLCLIPDRYTYIFSDGSRLDPQAGASTLTIPVALRGQLVPPQKMPTVVWRAGLDLNPLNPADPADLAWLQLLVWPEQLERRKRLTDAAGLVAAARVHVQAGDLLADVEALAASAPADATLVVVHAATLAYLTPAQRKHAIQIIEAVGARRLSFEARGVDPSISPLAERCTPDTLFVAALDGSPYLLADGHGNRLSEVAP